MLLTDYLHDTGGGHSQTERYWVNIEIDYYRFKLKFEDYITEIKEICKAILGHINNFGYKEAFSVTTDEQDK